MQAKRRYKKQPISHLPLLILNIKSDPWWSGWGYGGGALHNFLSAPGSHPNQENTVYVSKWVHTCRERNHIHTHKHIHIHAQMNSYRYLEQWFGFLFPPSLSLKCVFEKQGEECESLVGSVWGYMKTTLRSRKLSLSTWHLRLPAYKNKSGVSWLIGL